MRTNRSTISALSGSVIVDTASVVIVVIIVIATPVVVVVPVSRCGTTGRSTAEVETYSL